MPAPADTDSAPLDAFKRDTFASALLEAWMERESDPAPLALANETLFPPNSAKDTAWPVMDVPPPLSDCTNELAEIVMVEAAWPIPIPAPAEIERVLLE